MNITIIDKICEEFDYYTINQETRKFEKGIVKVEITERIFGMIIISPVGKIYEGCNIFTPTEWVEIHDKITKYIKIRGYEIEDTDFDGLIMQIEFREKNDGDY